VVIDGLSYRSASRVLSISKTEVGDSLALLTAPIGEIGICQPDGTFITNYEDLSRELADMAYNGEVACLDGAGIRTQRPGQWANSYQMYDAHHHQCGVHAVVLCNIYGDLLWVDGGIPGRAHELDVVERLGLARVLAETRVLVLADRGYRGLDRRAGVTLVAPKGQWTRRHVLGAEVREFNRLQGALRSCVERAVAHLANASAFRYWHGRIARVRAVIRAIGVVVSLSRWMQRVPA
jgi:hypothetical protein